MYGVVLMAALATSSSAPDFGRGGHGCYGGYGYGYGGYGCFGYGYGCHCYGNGAWHPYGGCHGYATSWGSYGGWGCYGGWGSYGSWGASPYVVCAGAAYGSPLVGGTTYVGPGLTPPAKVPPGPGLEVVPLPKKNPDEQARAKVRIEIPADAKLYVDGTLMKTGSSVRLFQTPALDPRQTYFYELKAELVRGEQSYTELRQIVIRPGQEASASFAGMEERAAAAALASASTGQR